MMTGDQGPGKPGPLALAYLRANAHFGKTVPSG